MSSTVKPKCISIELCASQDLGRHVLDGAAEGVGDGLLVDGLLAEAEVSQLDVAVRVQQDVLRLQVSENMVEK